MTGAPQALRHAVPLPARDVTAADDAVCAVPEVRLTTRRGKSSSSVGRSRPRKSNTLRYQAKHHVDLPHIVKFSGGRSSGMLLFILLENGLLKADRGDVVVFNNTSAEHAETYRFVARCKRIVEEQYSVPFFWTEFQTYEDARGGKWTRLPSYKLVTPYPVSEAEPNGYSWKGEVFEEMLSWTGFVPNQFSRTCTKSLKLEATRLFLRDWLACKDSIPRQGHHGDLSRIDDKTLIDRHKRNGGKVPEKILIKKKDYIRSRSVFRPAQNYADYSAGYKSFSNPVLTGSQFGGEAQLGEDESEYVSFIGLRSDEGHRVARIKERDGEHCYMPLATLGITKEEVNSFWDDQSWDLDLPTDASLSNCVYCFLKGAGNLQQVHSTMKGSLSKEQLDTPSDIMWWKAMEKKYGRDLKAEKRKTKKEVRNNFIGFFGSSNFSYELLEVTTSKSDVAEYAAELLPCDCTD